MARQGEREVYGLLCGWLQGERLQGERVRGTAFERKVFKMVADLDFLLLLFYCWKSDIYKTFGNRLMYLSLSIDFGKVKKQGNLNAVTQ